jgi:4-hydroxy-tetrahydrodipicolinate synthase
MLCGGKGNFSVTANVAPRAMHELCMAALRGDIARAKAINLPLIPLHQKLFFEPNPIPVKWALAEMGLIPTGIRLPLVAHSSPYHESLAKSLHDLGLLKIYS